MPMFDASSTIDDFIDPDEVPRPVMTFGMSIVTDGMELDFHRHRKAELLLTIRGVVTCEAGNGLWIVPPQCAIWIPAGVMHNIKGLGTIEACCAFIEPTMAPTLPTSCCTVSVTPLLRELLSRCAHFPALYREGGAESHLVTLLLDEIAAAPTENLHLPMPTDGRLRRIAELMMTTPSDRGTMGTWAKRVGLSERTLARMIVRQTGMSFGRWRQQFTIMLALQWLGKGVSIQKVAADLGYESAGSFVTMFGKVLGTSPGRYMAERRRSARAPFNGQAAA
ncbi:MAG: helix-turn-helix transcriptional regulator [Pseudomonadota bacterium]